MRYRPRALAVLGLGAYRTAFGRPRAAVGRQPDPQVQIAGLSTTRAMFAFAGDAHLGSVADARMMLEPTSPADGGLQVYTNKAWDSIWKASSILRPKKETNKQFSAQRKQKK